PAGGPGPWPSRTRRSAAARPAKERASMHDLSSRPTGMVRIADYLVERLQDHGVATVFGVPGDFVLKLFQHLEESPLAVVNTADEQGAGFAADAYARLQGLGAVCITWGVG